MAGELIALTLFALIAFLLGFPIFLVFGIWAFGFTVFNPVLPLTNISIAAFGQLSSFTIAAVPTFIAIGSYISVFGLSDEIVDLARSIGGWLPGSTGNTAIYTAGVFSAITGSNVATTASVGEALYDELEDEGYEPTFAAATIASGGTLGIIIPPSVLFILYGVTFNVPVVDLFIAGTIPGILMMIGLSAVCTVNSYYHGYGEDDYTFDPSQILRSIWNAKAAIGVVIILLGGIYSGIFTPSEAGSFGMLFVVLVGIVRFRTDAIENLMPPLFSTIKLMGVIIPIFVMSAVIQQELAIIGLDTVISDAILNLQNKWLIILALIVVMLITGSSLASVPNMILTAPLLAPAAAAIGLDPVMWGVAFMIGDAIGFITPPYGLNLFVMSGLTGLDYIDIARSVLPYLLTLMLVWVIFIVFPEVNILV